MINPFFISEEMRTAYLARMEETEVPVSSRAGQVAPATSWWLTLSAMTAAALVSHAVTERRQQPITVNPSFEVVLSSSQAEEGQIP